MQPDLFENILLPHELLTLPVGFVDHDLQNILATVGNIHHKEHQVLQKLCDCSDPQRRKGQCDEKQLTRESLVPAGLLIPPLILRDGAFFQLPGNRSEHFTGIVSKVEVSHLSRGDWHNGKGLFVLF